MPKKSSETSSKSIGVLVSCIIIIAVAGLSLWWKKTTTEPLQNIPEQVHTPAPGETVIDYNNMENDKALMVLMQKRKAEYGIEKGVDMITKSDESFKIGDSTVSMQEILDKIRIKSGDIVEKDLKSNKMDSMKNSEAFGIHVVQPGDNIWNIHFNFLKDYFAHKGISLSPRADEPAQGGRSSGVGKLLKFSESTVNIYNIKERKIDVDLNLIYPLSKVVIYNMDQIFALLDLIDYEHVNRIQFDGETLWIPPN
jgi:nitrogen regulatory protein PII